MKSEFEIAITQLSADRNLAPEVIMEAIEAALVSAYRRNFGSSQNVLVNLDSRTGEAHVYVSKLVVESPEDENAEISLAEARTHDPDAQIDSAVSVEVKPRNFGRIAAQTAKQVITQRIREAERDSVYLEYADRVGEIVNAIVRNVDSRSRNVVLSLGKAEAILPRSEQIPGEHYRFSQRIRAYIVDVERTGHGPQITASRTHRDLLRRLLELEVPEIFSGTVEIKAISREPGSRTKVAVAALQAGVDPVGSCVGMRGVRIQSIVNELNGEKIDVVAWSPDIHVFIGNSLSPAKVVSVHLNEQEKTAKVVVPDRVLSLAIGKEGQNARLAAKLTGWRIDIRSETEAAAEAERLAAEMEVEAARAQEMEEARLAAAVLLAEAEASLEEEQAEMLALADETETEGDSEETLLEEPAGVPDDVVAGLEAEEPKVGADETDVNLEAEQPEGMPDEVELELEASAPGLEEALDLGSTDDALEQAEDDLGVEEVTESTFEEAVVVSEEMEEVVALEADVAELEPDVDVVIEGDNDGEEDEDLSEQSRDRDRRRDRGRELEYDERLGRVVARKKHKPGRQSWEDDWKTGDWE